MAGVAGATGLVGVGVGAPGAGGPAGQETPNGTNETAPGAGGDAPDATVVLGGQTDGWLGLAPDAIEGAVNPAIPVGPGLTYRVVWINLDGRRHQFEVLDGEGQLLVSTGPAGAPGATRAVTFETTDAMAAYRCRFHPQRMRGELRPGEEFPGPAGGNRTADNETAANRTAGNETAPPTGGETVDVAVGPEGSYFRFVPEMVTISVGDAVRWTAESVGHNVSARPEDARQVELPSGAEPFSSYPEGESFVIIDVGESYEHTFTVPGEYVYVCIPHVSEGMVGTVAVEE